MAEERATVEEQLRQALEREQAIRAQLEAQNQQLANANRALLEAQQALAEERARLESVLRQMPSGVIIAEAPSGKVILANKQVADIWREPAVNVERYQEWQGTYPAGQAYRPADWPLARAIATGEVVEREEIDFKRGDGTRGTMSVSAAPVRDEEGRIVLGVAVFHDITELKQAEQRREEFVHTIAHDLRAPLTAILGQAQWLERSLLRHGLAQEVQSAKAIAKNARRMNAMLQDLVESIRLEAGLLELRAEPVDLLQLIMEIEERLRVPEGQQRIKVEAPSGSVVAIGDRERLDRAIVNLISNALKYSPADKPVIVSLDRKDGKAIISVSDQGVGIAPEDLPHIFERNYRAKTAGKRNGLGLGLYITSLIAKAHGGSVGVESELGKGSTFFITLPLSAS